MTEPDWAPDDIDIDRPSASRIYDVWLGGSHNFEVDREIARQTELAWPDSIRYARANRAFLGRAVRFLAAQGIRQFLDIGSGIPTANNVHEVARRIDPDVRVVYVDIDPVAVAHSRAILRDDDRTAVLQADVRRPHDILDQVRRGALLDLDRPVALLLVALMHFIQDSDEPYESVTRLADSLPSGSYLVLTQGASGASPEADERVRELYRRTPTPLTPRNRAEIERFFTGFELVEPGLVNLPDWRPDPTVEVDDRFSGALIYAGVGRKP
ncbi:SAM-dependent methyltransferase [Plantactinospora sp. S1510]|uniref:SAM-dependent methyltransferase n=1 Tax=Plantactinospora alkalitolerans TaxID=2789879 RepID=A0ABS0H4N7_9ACTN|nr:SAM-dependent methyltransferase [Plantactinospora alkalitolerans]MBF9133430.1 SAM-dependent methyltransferase [Plantactinospora alkalitolerans]